MLAISLMKSDEKRLNLHFAHEHESLDVMDFIMKAKGFSCQLEQYQLKD